MIHATRQPHFDAHDMLRDDERQPCEIWTRVMGYHRPVSSFNRGKQGEFYERQYFVDCGERARGNSA